jgi:hypothetical protein
MFIYSGRVVYSEVSQKRAYGKRPQVKALSPHRRFVIALHSPDRVTETGLRVSPLEKARSIDAIRSRAVTFDGPLSPVRFKGKTCRIAAIFNDSCNNAALFLCTPDCVAEREGFEHPSLLCLQHQRLCWLSR